METAILEIKENEFLRQFETTIEGSLVVIEYSVHPRNIFLTKLVMDDALVQKGYDVVFMEALFNKFKEDEVKIVPTSAKIVSFFRKNRRKYKGLLPTGINI